MQELKQELRDKVEKEYDDYENNLLQNGSKSEILRRSQETVYKNTFLYRLPELAISEDGIKSLLSKKSILDFLYNEWLSIDTTDESDDTIYYILDEDEAIWKLKQELIQKIDTEYKEYKNNILSNNDKSKIFDSSYETSCKAEIMAYLMDIEMPRDKIKCLFYQRFCN